MNLLIEYDGEHHFDPVPHFGGIETFNQVKKHDNIKTSFAKNNGIRILRIPYTEYEDIESILN